LIDLQACLGECYRITVPPCPDIITKYLGERHSPSTTPLFVSVVDINFHCCREYEQPKVKVPRDDVDPKYGNYLTVMTSRLLKLIQHLLMRILLIVKYYTRLLSVFVKY